MKCEYCDNPVPNGATRCPSCGAVTYLHYENPKSDVVLHAVTIPKDSIKSVENAASTYNPYLFVAKKSRIAYIVLGIVLGEIGVHNFYAGYVGRGVIQLLITVLSFGLLFWVSWIWAIIEICAVDQDGNGVPFD